MTRSRNSWYSPAARCGRGTQVRSSTTYRGARRQPAGRRARDAARSPRPWRNGRSSPRVRAIARSTSSPQAKRTSRSSMHRPSASSAGLSGDPLGLRTRAHAARPVDGAPPLECAARRHRRVPRLRRREATGRGSLRRTGGKVAAHAARMARSLRSHFRNAAAAAAAVVRGSTREPGSTGGSSPRSATRNRNGTGTLAHRTGRSA